MSRWSLASVALLLAAAAADAADPPAKLRLYVGTYTQGTKSRGIYRTDLDLKAGTLSDPAPAGSGVNPSFLAIHPNRRFLYAVSEVSDAAGKKSGAVAAYAIDPKTGDLALLNKQPSEGTGPCHVTVDKAGKNVLVANYGGGSVAVIPIAANGELAPPSCTIQHKGTSVDKGRQEAPHAHSINLDPTGRFAVAADLGLDKLLVYRFDPAAGALTPNDPPAAAVAPGSGPRHFSFHPDGRHAYVINEMASTLTALAWDPAKGAFTEIHTVSTLPGGKPVKGNSTAEVQVHPSGKFVYGSNRGHNSVAVFAVEPGTGKLTPIGHQGGIETPRNFGIDPTGRYLVACGQSSGKVHLFRIDPKTGLLKAAGEPLSIPAPVCVKFLPLD